MVSEFVVEVQYLIMSMDDDSLLESFDVIQIVTSLMDEFDISIDADDIEPENLNSLDAICAMVERKLAER